MQVAENEPTFASRVKGELGHSPVTFVASVLALLDVLYRVYEVIRGQIESPQIAIPNVSAPSVPSAGQAAFYLLLFIFLALLAQNLVSFVWYKVMTWISVLPMLALVSLTFLLCGAASLLTNYNMLILTDNIAQLYQFDAKWVVQFIFAVTVVLAAATTLFLTMSLVEEYDNAHSTDIEPFGVINLIFYIILIPFFALLLFPR